MKTLANTPSQALLLIFLLSYYACSLIGDVNTLKRVGDKEEIMAHARSNLIYDWPSGVDIYGEQLFPSALSAKRIVVFRLRNESLPGDLNFWSHAELLLDSRKQVGLIGYCDSQQCGESIRKLHLHTFPVLVFGDATDIEAVMDADVEGKAIIKDVGAHTQSTFLWRSPESSPQKAAQDAIR